MPEDFFAEEARIARQALRNLTMDTAKTLQRDADIRPLVTKRPWASLAAAAGGGLVAGYLLTPRRKSAEEKARLRAIKLEHRMDKKAESSGGGILGSLVDAVKPAINTLAASAAGMIFQNVQNSAAEQGAQHAAKEAAEQVHQRYQGPPPAHYPDMPHDRM